MHLEIGDPDFDSPDIAKDALKKSIDNNREAHLGGQTSRYQLKH